MMLHENNIKTILIERIKRYTEEYSTILRDNKIFFDNKIDKYHGIKFHHGYPFLIDKDNVITYPRGITGKIVMDVYITLKNKKIHSIKEIEGRNYKVRPKRKSNS